MNSTQTSLQNSPGASANPLTIRELSTEQQSVWIERILERLTQIYGRDFTYKWEGLDASDMKREWAETLGGFHAEDIAAALQSCRAQPKPPNLPEFAFLCRQNMNTRNTKVERPLTVEERAAAAKVAETVAKSLGAEDQTTGYMVNGIKITRARQWAVNLVKREAAREQIPIIGMAAWREVLGYQADADAKKVLAVINKALEAA